MLVVSRFRFLLSIMVCVLGGLVSFPSFVSQETFDKLPGFMQQSVSLLTISLILLAILLRVRFSFVSQEIFDKLPVFMQQSVSLSTIPLILLAILLRVKSWQSLKNCLKIKEKMKTKRNKNLETGGIAC